MDPMGMYRVASKKADTTSVAAFLRNLQVDAGDFGGIHRGLLPELPTLHAGTEKLHPGRLTWNLRIHPEKENHLPNRHFQVLY